MFGIKTKINAYLEQHLLVNSINQYKKIFIIQKALTILIKKKLTNTFSSNPTQIPVIPRVNSVAKAFTNATAAFMPNNLGNWSIKTPHSISTHLEKEAIAYIKNNYHCSDDVAGHFGSGSTEANIYATWLGKKFLQEKNKSQDLQKIVMLKSSLAHYSLIKAASINEVKIEEIAIKKPEYTIDEQVLLTHLQNLYENQIRGFLLPLTLGYTTFGTEDDYQKICEVIREFRKKHQDCFFFIWLDAAFNGSIKLYLEKDFKPFAQREIQLITIDFHKTMAIPYPSNVILYRKNLLKLIEQPIPYIDQKDTTLLGSRPGNTIISTWMTFLLFGENYITKQFRFAIQKKNQFMKKLQQKDPTLELVSGKNSLQMAIILKKKHARSISKQFQKNNIPILYQGKRERLSVAKFYFFPKL